MLPDSVIVDSSIIWWNMHGREWWRSWRQSVENSKYISGGEGCDSWKTTKTSTTSWMTTLSRSPSPLPSSMGSQGDSSWCSLYSLWWWAVTMTVTGNYITFSDVWNLKSRLSAAAATVYLSLFSFFNWHVLWQWKIYFPPFMLYIEFPDVKMPPNNENVTSVILINYCKISPVKLYFYICRTENGTEMISLLNPQISNKILTENIELYKAKAGDKIIPTPASTLK